MSRDIDIVLLWVDGNDPEWVTKKSKYLDKNISSEAVDVSTARYRDWDNLQYIFRGIELYMPWIRKVHFVTDGQKPEWLNLNYKKLNWVKHSDFIPAEYLPTFSANPIELNIHRIKGLADRFIYFNDDTFIIDRMNVSHFFDNTGLPKDQAGLWRVIARSYDDIAAHMYLNNTAVINQHFSLSDVIGSKWLTPRNGIEQFIATSILRNISKGKFMAMYFHHLPQAYRKVIFNDVWRVEGELLDLVCQNRFRAKSDLTHMLVKNWQLATNQFSPCNIARLGRNFSVTDEESAHIAARIILKQKKKMFCLNDWVETDFESIKPIVNHALDMVLPDKSRFEL